MKMVYTKRMKIVRFGRNEFLIDSSGKMYTKGMTPIPGKIDRPLRPLQGGVLRIVFK